MAYTNQSIIGAYNQAMAAGKSEGEFVSWANAQGVSNDQLMSARSDMLGAPAPAPAPSYTQDQINSAYTAEKKSGASDADLYGLASSQYGVTQDQFNLAKMAYQPSATTSTATAPAAPTYTQGQINSAYSTERNRGSSNQDLYRLASTKFGVTPEQFAVAEKSYATSVPQTTRFSAANFDSARQWANGKTAAEIFAELSRIGATPEEAAQMFGVSTQQLKDMTGYGSGINGFNADGSFKYQPTWENGVMANGTKADLMTFDLANNTWVPKTTPTTPTAPPTNQWVPSAPATGINLSQVQQAQQWSVQPNQTVQNQLQQIIANDSPLMQQARARALQQANERGLLNSSMAVTAGQSAVLDAAMPIAQQDASTFADAAKFNTGEVNTFARDNNAFTRDAFMADFNLAANEWAKTQDQYRLFDQMGYQQKLTLDRDAIQNGYQSARDAILNGYTVARDATTNQYTLQRDATQQGYTKANTADQNAFTKSQQDAQNAYAAAEAEKDRVAAERRAAMGIQAPNPDTSVLRTQMQIDADTANRADSAKTTAQTNLYNAKTQWGSKIIEINTGNLTADQKTAALVTLTSTYSPIISSYAVQAGLDPAAEVVGLRYEAPAPAATNVVNAVSGGGSGPNPTYVMDGG